MRTGLPARAVAIDLLDQVLWKKHALDDAMAQSKEFARLDGRDAGFARAIVATTLRRLGQIDDVLAKFLSKPLSPRSGRTRGILRTAVAEILFLDVPAHATVDSANALAAADRDAKHFKPLVNAVLRRIASEGKDIVAAQNHRLNTPDWLWERWQNTYGERAAVIVATHAREAPLDISVKSDVGGWAEKLGGTLLPTGSIRLQSAGRVDELPGFSEGAWWVQDAAAALPAKLFGDLTGKTAIDLCAAPGGKTAQLIAAGAQVTAVEISPERLDRLRSNLQRLKLPAQFVRADGRSYKPDELVDAILIDAPCLSTGTIRRHPDLPHLKRDTDLANTTRLQKELLKAAAKMLKPGGTIVFATCSLEPEEGVTQIDHFLSHHPELKRAPITAAEFGGTDDMISAEGDLRTLPFHFAEQGGLDGFYAARLRKA